ncbi:ribose-5-phosphate isomerase A [Bacteroides caccae]|nr:MULTISPECIES: ribose-5-phosphate isomerase A [Bacteroides]MCS2367826.1 ribose-5-phosphate isomerase A [Bacteroides caccae]MCS3192298.1 ribose-5-phosphate isomerase A [Bacteroides caccae]MDU4538286.1 ribose-5-phosphate isomerase A [Bacteroides sp.]MDU4866074.1 ribose-5-phosphate isomerase A [Bacteroides sp.]MDU7602795.1 ribose-5-phosphate isomerase A [Bacteroides caccae]
MINREAKERIACEIATMPKDGPVLTENGNFIPDTRFHYIDSSLEEQVKAITGAIESELFIGYDVEIITAE